jgi:group II intron reverse transcriptase/maturase
MAQKYFEIVRHWSERGCHLERVYRNTQDRELFLAAYGRIYANKGSNSPGVDPSDTIDGMSLERIDHIIEELKTGRYTWHPVKRVKIPKGNGRTRPIGISTWSDKLLQEVIRMVLEAYYEPRFSKYSHGFRPGRGCHTALREIYTTWKGTKWFIEADIHACFDEISHDLILAIIAEDIEDRRFLKLLKGMLKAGHVWERKRYETYSGTPQGSGASPILANIVLNELDKWVEKQLIPQYTKGKRRRLNPQYQHLTYAMRQACKKEERERYQEIKKERRSIPSIDTQDPKYSRLRYIRYCDDFLLGWTGSRQDALEIKRKIQTFLGTLGLTLSEEKTLITHATRGRARFLGYEIYIGREDTKLTKNKAQAKRTQRTINGKVVLSVPKDVAQKWERRYTRNGRSIHRTYLINCSDFEIIQTYGLEFQGLVNYYTMAHNVSTQLYPVKYAFQRSLAKTLAAKHKRSTAWVYRRYACRSEHSVRAMIMEIPNPNNPEKSFVAKFGDRPIRYNPQAIIKDQIARIYHGRNELARRLLANECDLCGSSNDIQVHHVRRLKEVKKKYQGRKEPPQWALFMMKRQRKTVVVCKACHVAIHGGKYDRRKMD